MQYSVLVKMVGKFVALLLILACVAQSYDARASPYDETRLNIDDIVKLLNELIAKIRAALKNLEDLFKDFEKKIKDIIGIIDLPGDVADLKKKIEDIINKAGVDANTAAACVADEVKAVEKLVSTATEDVNECLQVSDPVKNQLIEQIADISTESASLIAGITADISKCFVEHPLNPVKLLACLQGLVAPTSQKVDDLLDKINKSIEDDQKLIDETVDKLADCVNSVAANINSQKNAIVDMFQKCVDALIS